MPTVSVIIPTFGEPDLLENAICSVLSQTFSDLEVIVVDDNNPDTHAREKTEMVIEGLKADSRLKYIKHPKNKNGAAARNTGLAVACGKYIAFLDSDDEYMPDRIKKCVDALNCEENSKVCGVYTGCEFRRGLKTYRVYTDVVSGNFLAETLASTFMFCTGSNIFMKREVMDELSGFDESFLRHQDYEFLVRYFEKYDLKAIREVLVIKNNDNKNLPNPDKVRDIKEQYLKKYEPILSTMPIYQQNKIYSVQNILIAQGYMASKRVRDANVYYKKAKEYAPIPFEYNIRRVVYWLKSKI